MKEIEVCLENHIHDTLVENVEQSMPNENELKNIAQLFKVFGDLTRTRILAALFKHELCVCDICKIVDMNISAVSHQLRVLKDYNLVKFKKIGKEVFYSLADEHVVLIYQKALEHILEREEK